VQVDVNFNEERRGGRGRGEGAGSFGDLAKRGFDVAGAAAGLLLLAPVFLFASAAIWLSLGRPVFFTQERPGLKGKPFRIVKFRTMRPPKEGETWFRTDAERLAGVGRVLRSTSIDELPELWNVLVGDMSLVGPRPLLMEYLEKYTAWENRRHDVRPGITGWAQVNGRQAIPFSRRIALDVWYVEHRSLALDLRILAMTVLHLFRRGEVVSGQDVDTVDDLGLSTDRTRITPTRKDEP